MSQDTLGMKPFSLVVQLELTRFERALAVSASIANSGALLTTSELARLNKILLGNNTDSNESLWRKEAVNVKLPSGKLERLELIEDPILATRDKVHQATEQAENGDAIGAVVNLYVGMIKAHAFLDGNRRTAILAIHYFLFKYGFSVSAHDLLAMKLGDVRDPQEVESLKSNLINLIKKN